MTKFSHQELDNLNERIPGLINVARIVIVLSLLVFQVLGHTAASKWNTWLFRPSSFTVGRLCIPF